MARDVEIHNNHVTAYGINYFRGNAPSVFLGAVGDKKTPVGQQNYLAVEDRIPAGRLQVKKPVVLDVVASTATEHNLSGGVQVPGVGKLGAGQASEQLRNDQLKLVLIEVLPKDIVGAANASPAVLDTLKRVGNGGRLAYKVLVAMQAKTAIAFANSASVAAEGIVDGVKLTGSSSGGSSGTVSVELSPGTCFAYLLLEPKWDAKQNKNWTKIVDWEDDQWSLY